MRGDRLAMGIAAALLLAGCAGFAADDIEFGEIRTVNDQTIEVELSYSMTSRHERDVVLMLRPIPLTVMRELEITPMFLAASNSPTMRPASFRVHHTGGPELGIRGFTAALAEFDGRPQRPFHSEQFENVWVFPAQMPAEAYPVPYSTMGEPIDAQRLLRLRALISALQERGVSLAEAMRDKRIRRFLMLNAAISQEDAATADLEVAENMTSYQPPDGDAEGVIEVGEAPTEHPEDDGAERVPEITVTNIEAHERGLYVINFSYRIADVVGRVPLTFDAQFQGSANQWVTQQPFLHQYPERDCSGNGFITLWIDSPSAPLSLGQAEVRVRARGHQGAVLGYTTIRPNFSWYKRYDAITFQNLVDYCASPDADRHESVGLLEGSSSLVEYSHGRYDQEPAMLVFKTPQNVYCRGFFLPHRGAEGLEGVWIVDLDCFDPDIAVGQDGWLEGHLPADLDDWQISRRSYDNGCLLVAGVGFDLDRNGINCSDAEVDIVVQRDGSGKHFLKARNGCEMYY